MACFRCGVWITASLFLVYLTVVVHSADPNVVQMPDVDGVKLVCPSSIPNDTQVNWRGPDDSQLNFDNRTFADTRLSFVDDRDLQIANAVPNDNGIYTCVAGSQEDTVNLTVYVTDRTKVMVSYEGQYFDSTTGQNQIRTDMNTSLSVTCMVQGAFPMPELSLEIIDHNGTTYSMIPAGDVTIESKEEMDKTYSVNATTVVEITSTLFNNRMINCITKFNFDGKEESFTTSAYFYINEVTPTIFVYSGFRTLNPNDNILKYTCHGERGRPGIDAITYYIDGEVFADPYNFTITPVMCVLLTDRDQYYFNMYACNSSIEIYGLTKMDNGKTVGCDFTYQNETVGSSVDTHTIDFRFPPTMVNLTGNMPIEVSGFTQVSLTLTCMTDSSKSNATLSWYNGSSVITNTAPMTTNPGLYEGEETSQILTLSIDRYMDGNVITCRANHFYLPSPLSASAVLNISYSPEIIQPSMATYRVYSEEKISIPCSVLAKPAAEVKWMKVHSNTNKTEVTSVVRMSDSNIILKFDYVTTMHAGKYECQATNSILPSDSKMIDLIVLDKNKLQSYLITKLTPSPNSIMLEFEKPTDREIQSLFLQHQKLNPNGEPAFQRETEIVIPAGANTISVTLGDLQPDTSYTLRLREVDAQYGLVATIYLDTVRTSESDDKDNEYSRSDLNIAIIVSVLVTAAVVAIICIIIFVAIKKCGCCASSSTRYDMQMKPRA